MEKEIKHTPLPDQCGLLYIDEDNSDNDAISLVDEGLGGRIIRVENPYAHLGSHEEELYEQGIKIMQANAEFMVRACNSHYELLGIAKERLRAAESKLQNTKGWNKVVKDNAIERVQKMQAIIAKAEASNA